MLALGAVVVVIVAIAIIKRDSIAALLLKGGDTSLTGEPARSSPEAGLALDFLAALRTADLNAVGQLATAEVAARIQQEAEPSTPESEASGAAMLADLPSDPAELRGLIKSVQMHENRGVVTFETRANSWFVLLERVNEGWKVSGY